MNIRVLTFVCATALFALAAPVSASAQGVEGEEHCVINVKSSDVLNVRAKSNASSKVVTTLSYGHCGIVVTGACKGSWCPIEDGHDAGWVNSKFISMVSPTIYCVTGVAKGDGLNLRAFPSASSKIKAVLPRNQCDIVLLPYTGGNWQKVRADGHEGWANRKYLSGE
jgi:SH3-like domain-containing protein